MTLCKFTSASSDVPIYINPLQVLAVRQQDPLVTDIYTSVPENGPYIFRVREPPHVVAQELADFLKWIRA